MLAHLIRHPLLPLTALALFGPFAMVPATQAQPPAPAAPPAAAQQPAPIERQPPSDGPARRGMMRPGMRPGMQGEIQRGGGHPNFRSSAMMHRGPSFKGGPGSFRGGPGDGFHGEEHGGMGEGFRFGPGGMWWKNPMVVQRLTLTPDQVTRMDAIFQKSRIDLIDLKANLEKQEVMLEPLMSANPPDTAKASLQIDKVADARASLEKANAKMLLGIRGILTPDQWTKLHTHTGPGENGSGGNGGRRGPGGPTGMNLDDTRP